MKKLLTALLALVAATPAAAQAPRFELKPLERPAEPDAVPLYPAGSLPAKPSPERWGLLVGDLPGGGHMEGRIARNIAVPTITPVLPDPAKATGAAVVVAPGGAFLSLSMDTEGFEVARWFADHGIAAFVLKYRTKPVPDADDAYMRMVGSVMAEAGRPGGTHALTEPLAAVDALQAMRVIRAGAARWHVDPARVGIIGFSAGAQTALQSVLTGAPGDRPAFVGFIYGPMEAVPVPQGASPMFAAIALDDPLFGRNGFGIIEAWQKAGAPVELHAYQKGDHGFGAGRPGTTTMLVMDEFRLWLETNGMLNGVRP